MRLWKKALCGLTAAVMLAGCAPMAQTPTPDMVQPTTSPAPIRPVPTPVVKYKELSLTREEMPRLDGSTSTAPLARAVCAVLLGETTEEVADLVNFSRTTQSYRMLMWGSTDLLIAAEPANAVLEEKAEAGFEWEMAPIATDALVFLVNEDNPVDNLTVEQVQKIYTGEITNWKEVGGEDRPILPFQRNAEAGSQTLMQKLVMGELEMMEPERDYIVDSMAGLIEAVRSFDGSPGAIGYTVYYYANDMNMAEGLKVVSIDGAAPEAATIRSGEYPFTNPYYTTIAASEPKDSPARKVFEWLQGPVGQSLIQHEGYVSILNDPAPIEWDLGETEPVQEFYTRLSEEFLPELVPSKGYGELLRYVGDQIEDYWWGSYDRYGLMTRDGKIITDAVYDEVYRLQYYSDETIRLPIMVLAQTFENGEESERHLAMAATDGSWVTGFDWLNISAVAEDRIWAVELDGDGVMLDLDRNELWRLELPEGQEKWTYQGGMDGSMWWINGVGTIFGFETGTQYVDLEGNMILGSRLEFSDLQGYYEGLSAAHPTDDWNTWGYVDENWDWAIEPVYESAGSFKDGKAIVKKDGWHYVIDTQGNVLMKADAYLLRCTSSQGEWYLDYGEVLSDIGRQYWIGGAYDKNLQPLEWDQINMILNWGGDRYLWYTDNRKVYMVNPYETVEIPVENVTSYMAYDGSDYFIFQHGNGTEEDPNQWSVWNQQGEALILPTEGVYLTELEDNVTGETYFYLEKGAGKGAIYDANGQYLTDCGYWPTISDGLFSIQTDLSYGYKNLDGEWIFRISLMKSQGD